MKFAGWVTVGKKGVEENKAGGLTINAYEGHSKKDRDTDEWVKDGCTNFRLNVFSDELKDYAAELQPGDRVFVVGRYRQKEKKDGTGKDAKVTYFDQWTVEAIYDKETYNDSLNDIHEKVAQVKSFND